ncbi:MAG: hypothetical protein K1X35_13665 [Caulobacteraceae bacterium]|nr:hypothetical protein [Caulobacteraceae bacterium]
MPATNTLPEILQRLGLDPAARVLDVGGAAFAGEESTAALVEAFTGRIDVVVPKAEQRAPMTAAFGKRVRLLPGEAEARTRAYDLVVVSPTLGRIAETLADAAWRYGPLLKPDGVLITFGLDPAAIGAEAYRQPEPGVLEAFRALTGRGEALRLAPGLADAWSLVENTPRKPGVRSYLSWLVLRRTPAPVTRVSGLAEAADAEAARLLLTHDFDTVVVAPEQVSPGARRWSRIVEALFQHGRRLLWIDTGAALRLEATGPGLRLTFPSGGEEIDRRIKILGETLDAASRLDLERQALADRIARIAGVTAGPGIGFVSFGAAAGAVVQAALNALSARRPDRARQARWLHDDGVDGEAPAGAPRPDARIGSSPGEGREAIRDVQALGDRYAWRGANLREKLAVAGPLAVYSGSGAGLDLAAFSEVLAADEALELAVLGGRSGEEVKDLNRKLRRLRTSHRLTLLPIIAPADAPGFVAGASVGLIATDPSGAPEADEVARFSDYLTAGMPVVAPAGGQVAAVLADWPVGTIYRADQEGDLARAVRDVLADREGFAAAIARRPDLQLLYAWETQAGTLSQILRRLWPAPGERATRAA